MKIVFFVLVLVFIFIGCVLILLSKFVFDLFFVGFGNGMVCKLIIGKEIVVFFDCWNVLL